MKLQMRKESGGEGEGRKGGGGGRRESWDGRG